MKRFNPFVEPEDSFMAHLTCGIFENIIKEAGLLDKSYSKSWHKDRLQELKQFALNDKDYWWSCLREFCPTIDRKKIRRKIIEVADGSLAKL